MGFSILLVGGFSPFEKYERQIESFPQVKVKIKKYLSCHHLDSCWFGMAPSLDSSDHQGLWNMFRMWGFQPKPSRTPLESREGGAISKVLDCFPIGISSSTLLFLRGFYDPWQNKDSGHEGWDHQGAHMYHIPSFWALHPKKTLEKTAMDLWWRLKIPAIKIMI